MKKKIIVVLGMHRSGTSAIARGIVELGAFPGKNLIPEKEDNPKGFWENADIVNLNNNILSDFNMSWYSIDNPLINRFENFLPLYEGKYLKKAIDIITENLNLSNIILIKDPRISLLLPFWNKVFQYVDADVKFVLALRNPLETAKSLNKRDKINIKYGIKLWSYYNSMILKNLKSDVLVCLFSSMLDNSLMELKRIGKFIEIEKSNMEIENYSRNFLDKSLKHYNDDIEELIKNVGNEHISVTIYSLLNSWSKKDKMIFDDISSLFSELEKINPTVEGYIDEEAQIFLNNGRGFSEENSYKFKVNSNKNVINFTKNDYLTLEELRFDPNKNACMLIIDSIDFRKDDEFVGHEIIGGNFNYSYNNFFIFENDDPQIIVKPVYSTINEIIIKFSTVLIDAYTYTLLNNIKRHRNEELKKKLDEQKKYINNYFKELQEIEKMLQLKDKLVRDRTQENKKKEIEIIKYQELLIIKDEIIKTNQQELSRVNLEFLEFLELLNRRKVLIQKDFITYLVEQVKNGVKMILNPQKRNAFLRNKRMLNQSGVFNEFYYLYKNRDLVLEKVDPLEHFIKVGWKEGRNPDPNINMQLYFQQNPTCSEDIKPLIKAIIKQGKKHNYFE